MRSQRSPSNTPPWPRLRWSDSALIEALGRARRAQGRLFGKVEALGLDDLARRVDNLARELNASAYLDGEDVPEPSARDSVLRHVGGSPQSTDPHVDGLASVLVEAAWEGEALSARRIKGWHAAILTGGLVDGRRVRVGTWRRGPALQAPSAPPPQRVAREVVRFLEWFAASRGKMDGLLRAGVAHLWFSAIEPFEAANGRIARAVTLLALAQDEDLEVARYSLSDELAGESARYREALRAGLSSDGVITDWLLWFLQRFEKAIERADLRLTAVERAAQYWQRHRTEPVNDRQRKAIEALLDPAAKGGEGLTTRAYAHLTGASRATSQREIADLVRRHLLVPRAARGRSASYELASESDT